MAKTIERAACPQCGEPLLQGPPATTLADALRQWCESLARHQPCVARAYHQSLKAQGGKS